MPSTGNWTQTRSPVSVLTGFSSSPSSLPLFCLTIYLCNQGDEFHGGGVHVAGERLHGREDAHRVSTQCSASASCQSAWDQFPSTHQSRYEQGLVFCVLTYAPSNWSAAAPCGAGAPLFPPCPFTSSSFPLFTFPFLSLALPIFFFCPSLPFLPE